VTTKPPLKKILQGILHTESNSQHKTMRGQATPNYTLGWFLYRMWDKEMISFFLLVSSFFNTICWRGYFVVFTKVLTIYQIYHTWIRPFHYSPLSSSPLIPGIVSTGLISPFTYMYAQYLHHIHLPTPFPQLLPTPTSTNSLRQELFYPPVLWFYKQNDIFTCLR
jgi:hypothetical protein